MSPVFDDVGLVQLLLILLQKGGKNKNKNKNKIIIIINNIKLNYK
jgi:hypothetical protein